MVEDRVTAHQPAGLCSTRPSFQTILYRDAPAPLKPKGQEDAVVVTGGQSVMRGQQWQGKPLLVANITAPDQPPVQEDQELTLTCRT